MSEEITKKLDEIISRLKVIEGEIEKMKRWGDRPYIPWEDRHPDPYPLPPKRRRPYDPSDEDRHPWNPKDWNRRKEDKGDDDDNDDVGGGIAPHQGR